MTPIWDSSLFYVSDLPMYPLPSSYDEFYEFYKKGEMKVRDLVQKPKKGELPFFKEELS